ncbi:hypothetical protein [Actinomyces naeslundii]|nr:hypothetical protein [Actinomyces naeslundii]
MSHSPPQQPSGQPPTGPWIQPPPLSSYPYGDPVALSPFLRGSC